MEAVGTLITTHEFTLIPNYILKLVYVLAQLNQMLFKKIYIQDK